jgi:prepilin-type N-terminal cleavage/methylation domain-containing protein
VKVAQLWKLRKRGSQVENLRHFAAFTLIELMVVIAVILILAGLVLSISGYAMDKGKRSRAETEIAAMSAAMESYKADNGIYPRDSDTDALNAKMPGNCDPISGDIKYRKATLSLYKALSGDSAANRQPTGKSYFSFPPAMLHPKGSPNSVDALIDPWGNCYGYSTAYQANANNGYNPTFDLWSSATPTSSGMPNTDPAKFIKNW